MFNTNIDKVNITQGGLLLPSGNPRHFYARAMLEEFISISNGRWAEVTGSSPTPAWLQPYASTVTTTSGTVASVDQHCSAYFAADSRLSNQKTIIVRFWVKTTGIEWGVIDTAFGDQSNRENYFRYGTSNATYVSTLNGAHFLSNSTALVGNTNATNAVNFANGPWRYHLIMWDDVFIMWVQNQTSLMINSIDGVALYQGNAIADLEDSIALACFTGGGNFNLSYSLFNNSSGTALPQYGAAIPSIIGVGFHGNHSGIGVASLFAGNKAIVEPVTLRASQALQSKFFAQIRKVPTTFGVRFQIFTFNSVDWILVECVNNFSLLFRLAD